MLWLWDRIFILDPFGGAKPYLSRRSKEAPLRVNPERAKAFRLGSRRVDFDYISRKFFSDPGLFPLKTKKYLHRHPVDC
jgi:hypothetical protein